MGMHALFVCGLTALLLVGCDSSEDVGTQSDAGATVSAEAQNGAPSDDPAVDKKVTVVLNIFITSKRS